MGGSGCRPRTNKEQIYRMPISTRQKKQQDMGRYEGMIYSEKEAKMDKLTWLVLIFDDVKGVGEGKDCEGLALLFHLDKKVVETNYL